MKTYVINLDRSAERLVHMNKQLSALGIPFERIGAVDGSALAQSMLDDHSPMLPGTIGCFLSHQQVWQQMIKSGESHALVLEDDALLSPRLVDYVHISDWIPDGVDIVRIEGDDIRPVELSSRPAATVAGRGLHKTLSNCHGSVAYILTRRAAEFLLAGSSSLPEPLDLYVFGKQPREILKVHQIVPALARQLSMDTIEGVGMFASTIAQVDLSRIRREPRTLRTFFRKCLEMMIRLPGRILALLGLGGSYSTRIPFE